MASAMPAQPQLLIEGEGPTVVMIHGWPDTLRVWDGTVAALKGRYRCVRFTLPGFETPAAARAAWSLDEVLAFIARAVDQASPDAPVTLLLHDWGCFYGYQYATRHKARVARVIGVDIGDIGSHYNLQELSLKTKLYTVGYQVWLALAWKIGGNLGDRMARGMARFFHAPAPASEISSAMGYPYAVQWFRTRGGFGRLRAFVPTVPMLFVVGERKPFRFHSANWAERIRARPGCRVLGLPCGHWVMIQQPDAFHAAVLDWLQQTDAGIHP
ncbi:MAG: alpha/beta fold hydrolase [Rubrivivax sp.]|nr:alpha/beta fold hydrolase [Rubrivivax sp.]